MVSISDYVMHLLQFYERSGAWNLTHKVSGAKKERR